MASQRSTHPASIDVPATGHLPGGPGRSVSALVDGTDLVRRAMTTGYPDSFYSVPARASIGGRKIRGYITLRTLDGWTTSVPTDANPLIYVFVPTETVR